MMNARDAVRICILMITLISSNIRSVTSVQPIDAPGATIVTSSTQDSQMTSETPSFTVVQTSLITTKASNNSSTSLTPAILPNVQNATNASIMETTTLKLASSSTVTSQQFVSKDASTTLTKTITQHTISTTEGSTTFSSSNQMPSVSLSVTSSDSLKMVSFNTTSAAFNTSDVPMPMTTFSSNAMSGSPSTSAFTKISTETTATSNATTTTTPNVITETSPKPNTITTITRVTHLTNSSGNSDKEGMTPIPCEESSLGRLGLPVIFAMATVIAILLLIVVILITKQLRTSRRRRRMNDDRDMPRLKMIEIKDADTVRANQVHEDMHTYSLDYDRHVQEKIQEHRRSVQHPAASKPAVGGTTTFQLNKRPSLKPTVDVSSSTAVQPPKSAVPVPPLSATSTFQLAKRLSARGSSTSSTSGQPPPPPSPLLLPGETRHARDTDKANTDDDVFVFNLAKRPSESLTNRRESTRPETEPKKGNSAVTNQEGYGIDKYITDV